MKTVIDNKALQDKFISMHEDVFSKTIVKPLLEKMFNAKVEFVGGHGEKGKDLIVHNKDQFNFPDTKGIQVKKISPKINSAIRSFQQLINQISQMKFEGIICEETGNELIIKDRIFITPYLIGQKVIENHKGAFKTLLNENIKIIDGYRINELLNIHFPELIYKVLDDKDIIKSNVVPMLNNSMLMKALSLNKTENLCDIYCDVKFEIGSKKYLKYFKNKLTSKDESLNILFSLNKAQKLEADNLFIKEDLGMYLYSKDALSKAFDSQLIDSISEKSEELANEASEKMKHIKSTIANSRFKESFPANITNELVNRFLDEQNEEKDSLSATDFRVFELLWELNKERLEHLKQYRMIQGQKESTGISVPIDIKKYCEKLEHLKLQLSKLESNISTNLSSYLELTKRLLSHIKMLSEYEKEITFLNYENNEVVITGSINYPIEKVFSTKLNISVLGDAGSGKTTNLQVYAQNLLQNQSKGMVFFSTLNKIAELADERESKNLLIGMHSYLRSLGSNTSYPDFEKQLTSEKAVIILDSIDEAIVRYPWIITAVSKLKSYLSRCQIITSSRYSVDEVHNLDFVNISLLPFTNQQKREFFTKWFSVYGDDSTNYAELIMEHLTKHCKLNEIVTNPLSATILATLCVNNIPLPTTESSLYKKRFDLLSGKFDLYKGIKRTKSDPDVILELSRLLAFEVHLKEIRSFSLSTAKSLLINLNRTIENIDLVLEELVFPAEILIPNSNGEYGFGHLRFQEYLASVELSHKKSFSYSKLIKSAWWRDSIILYAQHSNDVDWIINDAQIAGYVTKYKNLLDKVISFQTEDTKEKLTTRINIALADERVEFDSDFDFEIDDNDNDNDKNDGMLFEQPNEYF